MNRHHQQKKHLARVGTEYRYKRDEQRMTDEILYENSLYFNSLDPWYDNLDWEQYWYETNLQEPWCDVPINAHCNCVSCYFLRLQMETTIYCSESWAQ